MLTVGNSAVVVDQAAPPGGALQHAHMPNPNDAAMFTLSDAQHLAARQAGSPLLVGAARLRVANVYLAASCRTEAVAVAAAAADDLPPRPASPPEETATHGALLLTAGNGGDQVGDNRALVVGEAAPH